ncbi:MAG: phenylacetate-CoA ligase [Reinekea sp.]|jgi:phenylacetate-CoA ligase
MIYKLIFILGAKLRNPSLFKIYKSLKKTEMFTADELKEVKNYNAREFFSFVYDYSPYYRQKFDEVGFIPNEIDDFTDLSKLPITEKRDLLEKNKLIRSDFRFKKIFMAETSGTSGESLEFPRDEEWDSCNRASQMRCYDWYGVKPWESSLYFWGFDIKGLKRIRVSLLDKLSNRTRLFSYSVNSINELFSNRKRIRYIEGYSSMIYEIAKTYNTHNSSSLAAIKMVKGTSEMIFDAYQPEIIKAFGGKMVSEYGAAEAGLIAFECVEGKLHIMEENLILEEDVDGALLVTNLKSKSFPIIRYRLGDSVRFDSSGCSCGLNHGIIREIEGRVGLKVIGRGAEFPALTIYYIFKNIAERESILINYKARQEVIGQLIIDVEGVNDPDIQRYIEKEAFKYFGESISITVVFIDRFTVGDSKRRYFETSLRR